MELIIKLENSFSRIVSRTFEELEDNSDVAQNWTAELKTNLGIGKISLFSLVICLLSVSCIYNTDMI